MENIQLEGKTIEPHYGRNVEKAPALLKRWQESEGYIPSEADIRLLGIRNFKNAPQIATSHWDTSTLSATKGDAVRVVLPYDNSGNHQLTEAAKFGLGLVNPNERLVDGGINLDVDGRWEKLDRCGVYTRQRDEWFEKGEKGDLIGLNADMTEEQAMKCPILLTKLGHPDYVDSKFSRSADEVAEIIGKTFELRKQEQDYHTTMGQYLLDVIDKGVLKAWCVYGLYGRAVSGARTYLDCDVGRFAFVSVGDAKTNAEGVGADKARAQLKTLEGILKPEQVDKISAALDKRDELREGRLTTDQIYSAVQAYVGSANETELRKVLDAIVKR